MALDDQSVLRTVAQRDVRFIHLWFTDILGQLKSFSINADRLRDALGDGIEFDGSSVTGFNAVEESDLVARPQADTLGVLPWRPHEQAAARLICDIETPQGTPYEGDSRHVLRGAIERAQRMGFDGVRLAAELEYYLFREQGSTATVDQGGYFDLTTMDAGNDVRRATVLALDQLGVEVSASHHESGPSQHEIAITSDDLLAAADDLITTRITVKEYALAAGWHATFMPRPLSGENGSGLHLDQILVKDGENAFADPANPTQLSKIGRQFVAGQLRHAREISILMAQWTNSYKRLVPGFEAPVWVAWSRRNRSAMIRVAGLGREVGPGPRVEVRATDPACNPYLALAGLLHAGLEGIEQGYELPEPMELNLYHTSPEERRRLGIEQLPENLNDAMDIAENSELMLRVLGEHMLNRLLELKRNEWEEYRVQVHQWERDRFLPIL
ncbi:MAG: glutamine synthetase [Solirubrobacteraceae bacterium]|nr:glutamine synthetase [Solirubrobacteraceae bacterium]